MVRQLVYYDLYDYGKYIGRYTPSELMVLLDIRHRQLICYYNDTGRIVQGPPPLVSGGGANTRRMG